MEADEQLTQLSEFKALQAFAITNEIALGDAIAVFIEPLVKVLPAKRQQVIDDYLWNACNVIIAIAAKTPHEQQGRLVQFVQELQKQTLKTETGEEIKHEDGVIWRDLPTFGWAARDAWNFSPKDKGTTAEQNDLWENQNAFFARLTANADALDDKNPLDYSLFALWTLREAFEDTGEEQTMGNGAVRAASMWMLYAADALWRNTKVSRQFEGNVGTGGGKFETKGWKGFNKERWGAWKEGFVVAQKAEHAIQQMEQAEKKV